ncbi:sporulation protein Cse60 [Lactobacillus reuteri]|uniref:sporulation protein Cse60 n=1 Tax=Limosilactobacillus reuteri TaxID=1598 RepID=UPI00146E2D18|nr:sporulation protein Cse60 [Limosilactobacillus reuteri]NMV50655.1 sporulation protein Cse60 [Limosilactobacillus reuteri]NMV59856.1 sporulation protein Cse60 [Limosilactobacillus reuteri]NMV61673.1 sporulation protein Cse60 [Limosilactobacillus reuteri]NMV63416.1 sporulation protein Cse60 [Limosilactobacillus reuteri]
MIKTKEFVHYTGSDSKKKRTLEEQINEFIKDKELIDIKYQITENEDYVGHYALVIYKDGDK